MGAVYEAEHLADSRTVALKLLSVDLDQSDTREQFLREGLAAAAINHPNSVYVYGTEEIEGVPAIAMELVPGGTLDDKIQKRGPLPLPEAVEDLLQVIDGLSAALDAGILHRDVKPSNCFVDHLGVVKIGDFGLSKPIDGKKQQPFTETGEFQGTPLFSSPEQLLGEHLDVRSDIYAVGVTFYYLLSGHLPFADGSMMQIMASVIGGTATPVTTYRPDLPRAVVDVLSKAMSRQPTERYQNYEELRAAVARLRVPVVVPASLWTRFGAAFIDNAVARFLVWTMSLAVLPAISAALHLTTPLSGWFNRTVALVIGLLIVAIPEGLLGASLGKWIIGLRVVGPTGLVPGYARAAARVLLLHLISLANWALLNATIEGSERAAALLLGPLFFYGLLLLTARPSNGWRLVHDVLTGTRVVRTPVATVQLSGAQNQPRELQLTGSEPRIGPYVGVGLVQEGSPLLQGWDSLLLRRVWIVPRSAGASDVSAERRGVARLTRLRWVGGRRRGDDSWDAFEAPPGEPFSARLLRPVTWATLQHWMIDVSDELIASGKDGSTLTELSEDSLWVTPADRILFADGGAMPVRSAVPVHAAAPFIAGLLDRIKVSTEDGIPLPRHATRAIMEARAVTNPADVLSLFQSTRSRPVTVTRSRRAGLMAATVTPIAASMLYALYPAPQVGDASGRLMSNLLTFVADSLHTEAVPLFERDPATRSARVGVALQLIRARTLAVSAVSPDTLRRRRELAEVYIATALAPRARDRTLPSVSGNTPREHEQADAILLRHARVDSATATAARALVDDVWKGKVPGTERRSRPGILLFVQMFATLMFGAAISIAASVFAGRGPMLRGFQVHVVTATGMPASRLRTLGRCCAIWSILAVPAALLIVAPYVSVRQLSAIILLTAIVTIIAWTMAMWSNLKYPAHGFGERVSGTYLVPD